MGAKIYWGMNITLWEDFLLGVRLLTFGGVIIIYIIQTGKSAISMMFYYFVVTTYVKKNRSCIPFPQKEGGSKKLGGAGN